MTTVRDLSRLYLRQHAQPFKSARSLAEDRRLFKRAILPVLGREDVARLQPRHVGKLRRKLASTPTQANRALTLLGHALRLGRDWRVVPADLPDPMRGCRRYPERRRRRYLSRAEIVQLNAVLGRLDSENEPRRGAARAVRLLLLTGARKNEVLRLRWCDVDLEQGLAWPHRKAGAEPLVLVGAAVEVLARQRSDSGGSPWVFPGTKAGPLATLQRPWQAICEEAGIAGICLHDLRRSVATLLRQGGEDLPAIAGVLGNRSLASLEHYLPVDVDERRAALERAHHV